jgi:hypothetical protein
MEMKTHPGNCIPPEQLPRIPPGGFGSDSGGPTGSCNVDGHPGEWSGGHCMSLPR